jgi:FKBP-type peptidyl-prolyl cis-trans isomerase FklB
MKFNYFVVSVALSMAAISAHAQAVPTIPAPFKTDVAAKSYAVGADMVRNFKAQSVMFDPEQLVRGITDASGSGSGKMVMSDADIKRLVTELETDVRKKMVAARKAEGEANLKTSEEFLKASAARPGVITLASGVQYTVEKMGTGQKPGDDSTVVANFKGTLPDGTVFDSSEPGKPVMIKVSQVIAGWREALKLMPAGSKWELTLPASVAYGERGAGRVIGPNQALRFEVEIVEIR